MSETPQSAEVIICGAGMAGICTAYYLAEQGVRDILVVDKRFPLTLTSDKSAETFRVWWPGETNRDKFALLDRSVELMEQLVNESGGVLHMQPRGHCHVTTDPSKGADFRGAARAYASLDLGPLRVYEEHSSAPEPYDPASEALEPPPQGVDLLLNHKLIEEHYPYLPEGTSAILHDRRSGYFSGHTLGMYLLEKEKDLGVRVLCAEVVGLDQDRQGVCAVHLTRQGGIETVLTRRFVNAAGPFVGDVATMLQVEVPVETGLWEKMVIDDYLGIVPRSAPVLVLHDRQRLAWSEEEKAMWRADDGYRWLLDELPEGVYVRPEGGRGSQRVLIGWAYNECPHGSRPDRGSAVGRDGAGAPCEPQWEPRLSKEFPELALRAATMLLPELRQYIDRMPKPMHDGGYFVKTEGQLPLIGPMGVDGTFLLQHDGMVMAGCAAGELCAAWVLGSDLPDYADGLSFRRYRDLEVTRGREPA
jgi:glycine/D-amino acid oxidase-like deaminating enzyme